MVRPIELPDERHRLPGQPLPDLDRQVVPEGVGRQGRREVAADLDPGEVTSEANPASSAPSALP
jgi:hypothetical protein